MNGKRIMYRDQFGNTFWASTVKELCREVGYSRAARMYRDTAEGTFHSGYVVGPHWCTAYVPYMGRA